jgi:hypothetical protein
VEAHDRVAVGIREQVGELIVLVQGGVAGVRYSG